MLAPNHYTTTKMSKIENARWLCYEIKRFIFSQKLSFGYAHGNVYTNTLPIPYA